MFMTLLGAFAAYWIFNDSKKHDVPLWQSIIWAGISFFFWYIALPIYFMTVRQGKTNRPPMRNTYSAPNNNADDRYEEKRAGEVDISEKVECHECGQDVPASFTFCPYCGEQLKPECPACGKTLEKDWTVCPNCGTEVSDGKEELKEEKKSQSEDKEAKSEEAKTDDAGEDKKTSDEKTHE